MDYTFKVTVAYDGKVPHWSGKYTNAIDAVNSFAKFVDWGTATSFSTVNLFEPNGKCHTKHFYRNNQNSKTMLSEWV